MESSPGLHHQEIAMNNPAIHAQHAQQSQPAHQPLLAGQQFDAMLKFAREWLRDSCQPLLPDARERYLAEAEDHADLERRMVAWDARQLQLRQLKQLG
jgi:hypothetical protein